MLSFSSPIGTAAFMAAAPPVHHPRQIAMIREAAKTPSEITSRLYLSGLYTAVDEEQLIAMGVTHIVSVIEHRPKYPKTLTRLKTLHIPVEDNERADILQHLDMATAFIKSALDDRRNVVLVHCAMGISRSPTVVCAYLVAHKAMTPHEALDFVVSRRHIISPNMGFRRQLDIYAARLRGGNKLRRRHIPVPPPARVAAQRSFLPADVSGWIKTSYDTHHSYGQMTRRGSMG